MQISLQNIFFVANIIVIVSTKA